MTSVLWFRRDLRLADHPALGAAAAEAGSSGVVGLYVIDPRLLSVTSDVRLACLLRSLASLADAMDGRLTVRVGDPQQVVPAVVTECEATSVHVSAATEPYGRRRDAAVAARLDVPLVATGSPYAVTPGRVVNGSGNPYQVFTPFLRAWASHGWRRPAPPVDAAWLVLPSDDLPAEPSVPIQLPPSGEAVAMATWRRFVTGPLATYDLARNSPAEEGTSRIGMALKWGELHPRTLLADLADLADVTDLDGPREPDGPTEPGGGDAGTTLGGGDAGIEPGVRVDAVRPDALSTFRSQLAWREFHADVLWHHPEARTTSLRPVVDDSHWRTGPTADRAFDLWVTGRTGYPLVDAGMRQLAATGWMHNRVRMVVASFLVKDLHLPWQRGAALFMERLLDADTAQNQLNWQWVAGTGRDASPYHRVFNPVSQGQRFDPDGEYVRRWVPELAAVPRAVIHEPWQLGLAAPADYPDRMVDHATERRHALAAVAEFRETGTA